MKDFDDILGDIDEIVGEKKKPVIFATFVLDHSGSMMGDEKMCIDNFNEQIQSMKKQDGIDTFVTTIEFDNKIIETGPLPLDSVREIDEYWTGGTTALNDSIARAISLNKKMMASKKYEDKSSLIIVVTDGHENASKEFHGAKGTEKLQKMIGELQDQGDWTFTFMAADLQIQKYATEMLGIGAGNTMCFDKSAEGYSTLNASTIRGLDNYYDMRKSGRKSVIDFVNTGVNEMVTKQDGPLIGEPKTTGDPLWGNDGSGDLLRTEGPEGNPLWKEKKKLNEDEDDATESLNE